jgi:uncharacterized surface protein with fasciclin (FAS1) repeats
MEALQSEKLFASIVRKSELDDDLERLKEVTVMAPTDRAVAEFLGSTNLAEARAKLEKMPKSEAERITLLHTYGGRKTLQDMLDAGFINSGGNIDNPSVRVPVRVVPEWGPSSVDSRGTVVLGNATVTKVLSETRNGIVYSLSQVIREK